MGAGGSQVGRVEPGAADGGVWFPFDDVVDAIGGDAAAIAAYLAEPAIAPEYGEAEVRPAPVRVRSVAFRHRGSRLTHRFETRQFRGKACRRFRSLLALLGGLWPRPLTARV